MGGRMSLVQIRTPYRDMRETHSLKRMVAAVCPPRLVPVRKEPAGGMELASKLSERLV